MNKHRRRQYSFWNACNSDCFEKLPHFLWNEKEEKKTADKTKIQRLFQLKKVLCAVVPVKKKYIFFPDVWT